MARQTAADSAVTSPLLTAREAMAFLRCGRTFLTEHRAELGGIKRGGNLMFDRAGLQAYLDRQRIQAPDAERVESLTVVAPAPTPIRKYGIGPTNPLTGKAWT